MRLRPFKALAAAVTKVETTATNLKNKVLPVTIKDESEQMKKESNAVIKKTKDMLVAAYDAEQAVIKKIKESSVATKISELTTPKPQDPRDRIIKVRMGDMQDIINEIVYETVHGESKPECKVYDFNEIWEKKNKKENN